MDSSWCVGAFGAGWVGALTMAYSAHSLPSISHHLYDPNTRLVGHWQQAQPPFYEPGLDHCLSLTLNRNLFFSCHLPSVLNPTLAKDRVLLFLCVATPAVPHGLDTCALSHCLKDILLFYSRHSLEPHQTVTLVVKSTVPVSTCQSLSQLIPLHCPALSSQMAIVSNPEFLSEGRAMDDLARPARIVIGSYEGRHGQILREYYERVYDGQEVDIVETKHFSSELAKLAANSMLAQRVSSINSLSQLCEKVGADIQEVKQVLTKDTRIGTQYLEPGAGFGGSCLEKDLHCLVYLAHHHGLDHVAHYWQAVLTMNQAQQHHVVQMVLAHTRPPQKVLVVGLAFKSGTSDVRNSHNIRIVHSLLRHGLSCVLYDELAQPEEVRAELDRHGQVEHDQVHFGQGDLLEAAQDCQGVLVLLPFYALHSLDTTALANQMHHSSWLIDTKHCLDQSQRDSLQQAGVKVIVLGR